MRKLAWFVCAWAAATAIAAYLLPLRLVGILAAAGLLAAAALALWTRLQSPGIARQRALCLVLGAALAFSWYAVYDRTWVQAARNRAGEGVYSFTAMDDCRETDYGGAVSVRLQGGLPVKAELYLDDYDGSIRAGDTLTGQFSLTLAEYKTRGDYYTADGTLLIAEARGGYAVLSGSAAAYVLGFPQTLARALRQVIDAAFPARTAGLLKALLTGDRSGMSYAQSNNMKLAGVYHAVAISGLHINLLMSLWGLLVQKRRRRLAAVGIPAMLVFAAMTGAAPSVCRAVVMQTILLLAPLLGREHDRPAALAAALLLLLLPNPLAVRSAGLQLSFSSVAGILLLTDPLYNAGLSSRGYAWLETKRTGWLPAARFVLSGFSVSLGASALTLPLCALYFGTISLLAPLTTLLGLWAVTVLFAGGMAVSLLGLLWLPLAQGLAWLLTVVGDYLDGLCAMLARFPLCCLYPDTAPQLWLWLVFSYLAAGLWVWKRRQRPSVPICCAVLVLCAAIAVGVLPDRLAGATLRMLDVGQGQCLVLTSGASSAVIDCGGSGDETGEQAARQLLSIGEYSPELLVLTHYDADHAGGAVQLLSRLRFDTVCLPNVEPDSPLRRQIEAAALAAGSRVVYVTQDLNISLGTGRMRLFAADTDGDNACVSLLYSLGGWDLVVTGDMDIAAEDRLLARYDFPDTEVLAAGHHGSKTSTGAALLEALQPETVLISVGADNRYGHPADQTLARIAAAGAAVYRTDRCGTITIRED